MNLASGSAPLVLGLVVLILAAGAALLIAARVRARRMLAPKPTPPRQAAPPPLPEPAPATRLPTPDRRPPVPAESADERRRRREEEEAEKRAAYRARKEQEASEREERREREELRAQEEAEAARRQAEEQARREAAEAAERQRKEGAEAGKTLLQGLEKTRGGFMSRLNGLFGGNKTVPDELLGNLEEVLFSADIGVKTATQLLAVARENLGQRELADPARVRQALRAEMEKIVTLAGPAAAGAGPRPKVWMVIGVNGVGKTTTIGKLAAQETARGQKVVLGAADTFRAAAAEQLAIWAQRAGADLVRAPEGSDPGSVAFESVRRGVETGADLVIVDTAGRLHTKLPLMEELKKVKRVLEKARPGAPDELLLVLDSTNGQNAIAQARQFHEALGVTGMVLTKLDGTAKGGVVIGICEELKIPVRYVGIGEAVGDLQRFEPHAFVEALFA